MLTIFIRHDTTPQAVMMQITTVTMKMIVIVISMMITVRMSVSLRPQ